MNEKVKEVKVEKKKDGDVLASISRRLSKVVKFLEEIHGADIDGDSKIGYARIGTMLISLVLTVGVGLGVVFAEDIRNYSSGSGLSGTAILSHDGTEYTWTTDVNAMDDIKEATSGAGVIIDLDVKIKDGAVLFEGTAATEPFVGMPLAATPVSWYSYFEDFFVAGYVADAAANLTATNSKVIQRGGLFSEVADQAAWLVTVIDVGTDEDESIVATDSATAGWLTATTADGTNDALNIQLNGESFAITATKDLWFECKFEISDISEDTVFVGLTVADTDVLGSLGNDFMGFYLDQSTNIAFQMAKNGVIVTNAAIAQMADATGTIGASAKRFGFYADGSSSNVYVYVDGVLAATHTASTNLPNDEVLSPALCIKGTDAAADALKVDYLMIKAQR